ncbi:MAG: biotin-dependent carboxyltransferase family protein [Deltaproteobacteria bacterium]|nr:biotin-dependent carboxyltransferase family protein [Deltaproteobacteria bacterium]
MITVVALRGGALVVDGGARAGHASLEGGAFDDRALARANRALGNPWWQRAVEVLLGPITLQSEEEITIASAGGADVDVITVAAGGSVVLRPSSLRMVVAVRGGLALAPGTALATGDRVPLARAASSAAHIDDDDDGDGPIRVVAGAERDRFDVDALALLCARAWTVDPRSSRLGIRLQGDALPVPAGGVDVVTRGAWTGGVQVLPSGLPLVLGVDQRRTGGYARLAHVISVDRHRLAQLRPGHETRFVEVELPRARELRRARAQRWSC